MRRVKSKPFSTSFSKQIKEVSALGVEPLKIHYDNLVLNINNFSTDRCTQEIVDRCKNVLFSRLKVKSCRERHGLKFCI